jgi:hypothetical protein
MTEQERKEAARQYLAGLHTKQLMNLRDAAYAVSNDCGNLPIRVSIDVSKTLSVTMHEIKAELATRPHIPNAVEAKAIRQQKAKEKQNR